MMRLMRLLAGAQIVLGGVWIIVGEHLAGASANAFVNARLVTLRAPVAGDVTLPVRALGASVERGRRWRGSRTRGPTACGSTI